MKIADYVESQIKGLWGTDFDENGIPVIKTNNLTYEGFIDYSDICKRNIPMEQAKQWYLKHGDLLIEKSGGTKTHSVGYVSYFEGENNKFVCNNFILALRLKNTINSKFLFYQIQFKYDSNQFADCFNKTTGIQNLKIKDYLDKEIKVYAPEKQAKIVKELDIIRNLINKNKEILSKYDILIKSRFIEMFGDPLENSKHWETQNLGNLCVIVRGGSPRPIDKYLGGNIPWIKIGDATNGDDIYLYKTKEYIIEEGIKKSRLIPEGSLIFANCGVSLGFARIIRFQGCIHDGWLAFQNIDKKLNNVFLLKSLNMCTDYFRRTAPDGTQPNLNTTIMKAFIQILPPISLQNEYVHFVEQIDKSKFAVQKSLEKTETLYKSLMQGYFG